MHGSVDWWDLGRARRNPRLVKADVYPGRVVDHKGRLWDGVSRPVILVGTFNKMLDYLRPGNLTRLAVVRRALMGSRALVVAGYSFRDKGVNSLLVNWAHSGRRMIVVSPYLAGEVAPANARPAIRRMWPKWLATGVLTTVAKRFDEVDWPTLRVHGQ
jgi:hypothetical protein